VAKGRAEVDALKVFFKSDNWRSFVPRWDFFDRPGISLQVQVRVRVAGQWTQWSDPWQGPQSARTFWNFFFNPEETLTLWWDSQKVRYQREFAENSSANFTQGIRCFWREQAQAWASRQQQNADRFQLRLYGSGQVLELSPEWGVV
jgi:hypothetical protein